MLKRVIDGWNAAPGAPKGWNAERDGECGALRIRVHPPEAVLPGSIHRVAWVESAWEPTPRELAAIARGRSIILRIIGWQVPVALYVDGVHPGDDLGAESVWVLSYADATREDEVFTGDDAEMEARRRFEAVAAVSPCSLFREVARA